MTDIRSSALIHGITTCEAKAVDDYSVLRIGPRAHEYVFFLPPGVAEATSAAFTAAMAPYLAAEQAARELAARDEAEAGE